MAPHLRQPKPIGAPLLGRATLQAAGPKASPSRTSLLFASLLRLHCLLRYSVSVLFLSFPRQQQKKSSMWYRFIAFVCFSDNRLKYNVSYGDPQPKPRSSFGWCSNTAARLSTSLGFAPTNGTPTPNPSRRQRVGHAIIFGRHKHTSASIQGRGPNRKKE